MSDLVFITLKDFRQPLSGLPTYHAGVLSDIEVQKEVLVTR